MAAVGAVAATAVADTCSGSADVVVAAAGCGCAGGLLTTCLMDGGADITRGIPPWAGKERAAAET